MKKRHALLVLMLLCALGLTAQTRHWQHALQAGAGLMVNDHGYRTETGLASAVGYTLGYRFAYRWSAAAGVTIRNVAENVFADALEGADDDTFTFLDVPLQVRLHFGSGMGICTAGLGPVLSFCIQNDTYYIDANPDSPLNTLNKCRPLSLGLQPTFSCQLTRHLFIGADAHLALTNQKDTHHLTQGSKRIHSFIAKIGFCF